MNMKTELYTITDPAEAPEDIRAVGELLAAGELAAIPTETVYGLAANAFDGKAVTRIFEAKGRPQDNPLIVHIARIEELYSIAREVPAEALRLAEKYWPGPLTIILPKSDKIPEEVSAGLDTVAVRMPSHPVARAIIRAAGVPLAAPSANISGFPSPTAAQYVIDDMNGRIAAIVDGGDCEFGIESTVVTLATQPPRLLRPGAVTHEQLEDVLGTVEIDPAVLNPLAKGAVAASPGMKYKHYSPKAQLYIVRGDLPAFTDFVTAHRELADHLLVFEGEPEKLPLPCITFGKENDSLSQAQRLFDALRELDEDGAGTVFVRSPSEKGVGLGVCNRLYRSAAFRFLTSERGRITGLTGGSGAGKSALCELLAGKGCVIIDADRIARSVTAAGSPVLPELARAFGEDILNENGELDRRKLASRAFFSEENAKKLSSITHPAIIEQCRRAALLAAHEGRRVIVDAPLLFSSGLDTICDDTARVIAPAEVRIRRITERDGITREEAEKRLSVQNEELALAGRADLTLVNDGENDLAALAEALYEFKKEPSLPV